VTSFVDTSFFFALASAEDPDHERVREVFEDFDPKRLSDLWLTSVAACGRAKAPAL
jgi:predicted nucleic acid-binding protein